MSRILIVEDEQHIADGLRFNLEAEGYEAHVVPTGEEALEILLARNSQPFDVMVLDVMLPGKDGFSVISEARQAGQLIPTLILTARGHSNDVLKGFSAGADDYLTKPFELAILLARVQGLLRRRQWAQARDKVFRFGNEREKSVDLDLLELCVGEQVFRLTLMEANVLRFLIQHEGKPVSRKQMIEQIWGLREDTDTRPIDNFIVRLRRYIEVDPTSPKHLLTVRGVGYQFVACPGRPR
jgi:DNA-binding response OmpR family regulator